MSFAKCHLSATTGLTTASTAWNSSKGDKTPSTVQVAEPGLHKVSQEASKNIPYELALIHQSSILSIWRHSMAHKTLWVFPGVMDSSPVAPLQTEVQQWDQSNASPSPHLTKLSLGYTAGMKMNSKDSICPQRTEFYSEVGMYKNWSVQRDKWGIFIK